MTAPAAVEKRPRISGEGGIADLLAAARRGSSLLLSTQPGDLPWAEGLRSALGPKAALVHAGEDAAPSAVPPQVPDHVVGWVNAGSVLERLLESPPPDFVLCLDPWAASLVGRRGELFPRAAWIFVSDLDRRRSGPEEVYWNEVAEWIRGLPLDAIVSRDEFERKLGVPAPRSADPPTSSGPQAWRWVRLNSSGPIPTVVVHYRDFLSFRVFIDSLVRQEPPGQACRVQVVVDRPTSELERYLKLLGVAHSSLRIEVGATASQGGLHCDSNAILPPDFLARVSKEAAGRPFREAVLPVEVATHILVGNLDPVAHYHKLRDACRGSAPGDLVVLRLPDLE